MFLWFTDKIAKVADVFDCHVCEVGAGLGSLTRSLLHAGSKHVAAVEIDRRFLPSLEVTNFITFFNPKVQNNISVYRFLGCIFLCS